MEGCHLRVIRFNPRVRKPQRATKPTTDTATAYGAKIARLEVDHPGAADLVKRMIDQSMERIATRT